MRSLGTSFLAITVLVTSLLGAGCGSGGDDASTIRTPSRSSARARANQSVQDSVDLESLLRDVPEYGGSGRNLFAFGSRPVVAPPPTRETSPPPPPPPPPRTTPAVSAPRIDLKFAGLVETRTVGGELKKYAVLLDGTEILTGAEGDLVANRYRIVQIGLESVTVGVAGSNDTQQIPLQSN